MAKKKKKQSKADCPPEPTDFETEDSQMNDEHSCDACNEGLLDNDDIRTGFISGPSFKNKPVQYAVVNGRAFVEGCMCVGTVEEMESTTARVRAGDAIAAGVGLTGDQFRWPNGVMPYEIDPNLPNQQRVTDAIAHWRQKTDLDFVERTSANAAQHLDYVYFTALDGCWSFVGKRGGKQEISLASGCGFGATVHEIGHAFGLWHEQSREDRDSFVTIQLQNIKAGREHNFNQHISDGDDLGSYNYDSIMHYGRFAFSKNNQATIVPTDPNAVIGQRNGLSQGDVDAAHTMYGITATNLVTTTVTRAFSTSDSQNAWGRLQGIGWRKIKKGSADGVTNIFAALCAATANGQSVSVKVDSQFIHEIYV